MIRTTTLIATLLLAMPAMAGNANKGNTKAQANFATCSKPIWPAGALAANRTGTVTLGFEVDTDGKIVSSKIEGSSGHADLDEAAREGIAKCTFKPGTSDGKPVRSSMKMQYVWTLK